MKVCDRCFKDEEIKQYIISTSVEKGICDCCSEESNIIDIEELLDFFNEFLSIFKYDGEGISLTNLVQTDWGIFSSYKASNKILSSIISELKPSFQLEINSLIEFNSDTPVSYIDEIVQCVSYWDKLKDDLKWRRRFLTDIDEMIELGWDASFNVYSLIDSSTVLYRARINQDGQIIPYDISEMGAPSYKFTSAGRANPQGIPYLYLSKSATTTLYEIRATYLDNISIGTFQISEKSILKLVDFTGKQSPFSEIGNIMIFAKGRLLREVISKDLSKPLRRYDSELEYIPTQFICEFIRYVAGVDGVQFSSSLDQNGVNVVLFNQENISCIGVELHQVTEVKIESKKDR